MLFASHSHQLFALRRREMSSRVVMSMEATTTHTLTILEKCKTMTQLRQIQAHMIKTNLLANTFAATKLVSFCCLSGGLNHAVSIFHRIQHQHQHQHQHPNPFIYFMLINYFSQSSNPLESITLYAHMLACLEDWKGVEFSLPSVLKVCGRLKAFEEGRQVHGQIFKTDFLFDPFVANSVIRMYVEFGQPDFARQVFDEMPERDVISWNSMITGYVRVGDVKHARELFDEMPVRDLVSYNAMIDGYGKCGMCELAEEIFGMAAHKDVKTWTSMISAYVHTCYPQKALDMFRKMMCLGVQPDAPALVSVLSAIAELGFVEDGKWVHTYISTKKLKMSKGFIGSALIDMYAKCGHIENAYQVFRSISHNRRVGDWNAMISGLAIHGLGAEARKVFHDMERMDIAPDEITFLGLLGACGHGGLVDEAHHYFRLMQDRYKIIPKLQHYGCIIDLLGRAGHLEDALRVLRNMPFEPDVLAWKAILGASMKHENVMIGENAAFRAIELAPEDSSCYVLLSNIYAKLRRWDNVAKIRSMMKQRRVGKIPGCSSILVKGKVHVFLVGKAMDEKCTHEILSKIEDVVSRLKLEGYKPDLSQVLLDVEAEGKESLLSVHSEKMALAFGLINTSHGAPVHIVKNLRVCCDCHSFMKLVSRVYNRRIVVRDQNRFHHFENGFCSCKEYW